MEPAERTAGPGLIQAVLSEAPRFSFYQLVQILERYYSDAPRIGHAGPAAQEALRFRPERSLAFQRTDVSAATLLEDDGRDRCVLETTFLGLYGTSSPLPSFYTEEILHEGDETMVRAFLDIFNHRLLSLLYRCWEKYRYYVRYRGEAEDDFSAKMFCMIGLGTALPPRDGAVPPRRLLHFSGLLLPRARPAASLRAMLTDYFDGLPTRVEQFVMRWVTVPEDLRNRLGIGNSTLGEDLHAGQMVMDRSGKFRITFGPVGIKPFLSFLPHERNFAALDQMVRLFVTDQLEYEVEVILKREEIPNMMLSEDSHGAYLGQTTWLGRPSEDARVVFQEPRRDRWNHLDEVNEGRAAFLAA